MLTICEYRARKRRAVGSLTYLLIMTSTLQGVTVAFTPVPRKTRLSPVPS